MVEISFVIDRRLAVGGGIWTAENMAALKRMGFTHIVNLQMEFDDRELAAEAGIEALWNPTDDDFSPKPAEFFERSIRFALAALADEQAQVYVHCAAGIHRAPLTTAAILHALGFELNDAIHLVAARRAGADFPEVYVDSLRLWAAMRQPEAEIPDDVSEDGSLD